MQKQSTIEDEVQFEEGSLATQLILANQSGDDYVIGDVHGNFDVLKQCVKKMKNGDRLFIAGDLIDRGNQNLEIIEFINQVNHHASCHIYVVRGNHENLVLNCIHGLEIITARIDANFCGLKKIIGNNREKINGYSGFNAILEQLIQAKRISFTVYQDIKLHNINGGKWLIELFIKEFNKGFIQIKSDDKTINYHECSKIYYIKQYMQGLPYILHIEGNELHMPFNVVHADLHLTDQALAELIQTSRALTSKEKEYLTWAREQGDVLIDVEHPKRTQSSVVTFVGHNIIMNEGNRVLRQESNTVNLDVGSFYYDICAFYCATDPAVEILGRGLDALTENKKFMAIKKELLSKVTVEQSIKDMYVQLKYGLKHKKSSTYVYELIQLASSQTNIPFSILLNLALNTQAINDEVFNQINAHVC